MADELRPVCFVAMPFGEKKVSRARDGAPQVVNFDSLWDKAYRPAIEDAGYTPIRADFDTGSVIVKDMLERLAFADLVLADLSLPNGNVYYEVGLRHVAQKTGCILFAAGWSRQLFDVDQFTTVRYELSDGAVPDDQAEPIRTCLANSVKALKHSKTPWHEFIADGEKPGPNSVFHQQVRLLSEFQSQLGAIRLEPDKARRRELVKQRVDELRDSPILRLPQAATELLIHVRDLAGDMSEVVTFIDSLDNAIRNLPFIQEQRLLALGKVKSGASANAAAAALISLIDTQGGTPERWGLLGGRYKTLWRQARESRISSGKTFPTPTEMEMLSKAIDAYEKGMQLDLNEFYCSSNLALLLTARGEKDDLKNAPLIDRLVVAACERVMALDETDEWVRPTLLGAAFRSGDQEEARRWLRKVAEQGVVFWKIDTTVHDLKDYLDMLPEGDSKQVMARIVAQLEEISACERD
ncbi:MAG: TRAFs-binding domain-containing protein [Granulosicoccus sp.]